MAQLGIKGKLGMASGVNLWINGLCIAVMKI